MDRFGLGQHLNLPLVTHTGMGLWAEGHSIPCETLEPVTDGEIIENKINSILTYLGYNSSFNPDRPDSLASETLRFRLGELIGIILNFRGLLGNDTYAGYLPKKSTTSYGVEFGYMRINTTVITSFVTDGGPPSHNFGLKEYYFKSNLSPCDNRHRIAGLIYVAAAAKVATRLLELLGRFYTVDERRSFMLSVFERFFGYLPSEGSFNDYLYHTNFPYGGLKYEAFTYNEADYLTGRSDTLNPRPVYRSVKPLTPVTVIVSGSDTTGGNTTGGNTTGGNTTGGNTTGGDTIIGNLPQSDPSYTTPADDQTTTMGDKSTKKSGGIFPLLALGVAAYFATKD